LLMVRGRQALNQRDDCGVHVMHVLAMPCCHDNTSTKPACARVKGRTRPNLVHRSSSLLFVVASQQAPHSHASPELPSRNTGSSPCASCGTSLKTRLHPALMKKKISTYWLIWCNQVSQNFLDVQCSQPVFNRSVSTHVHLQSHQAIDMLTLGRVSAPARRSGSCINIEDMFNQLVAQQWHPAPTALCKPDNVLAADCTEQLGILAWQAHALLTASQGYLIKSWR
jgi:hypothetical protein